MLEAAGDDFSRMKGEPVLLRKGKNPIVVRYEPPADGDVHVRLLWQIKGEALPEPPGPQVWTHNAGTAAAMRGQRLRDGRFLLAQLRCVKCHATPATQQEPAGPPPVVPANPAEAAKPGPMPELAMDCAVARRGRGAAEPRVDRRVGEQPARPAARRPHAARVPRRKAGGERQRRRRG